MVSQKTIHVPGWLSRRISQMDGSDGHRRPGRLSRLWVICAATKLRFSGADGQNRACRTCHYLVGCSVLEMRGNSEVAKSDARLNDPVRVKFLGNFENWLGRISESDGCLQTAP
jgi:hypothetical protein